MNSIESANLSRVDSENCFCPSTVSSIFTLKKDIFDLIIFDEASQSPVADSLTSLYRASLYRVVVIGDEKQLRPSDLFELKDEEYKIDEDIDRILLSESLLSLTNRAFNYNCLKWHQELTDFSNHAFYEGRLKIAPNILKEATPLPFQHLFKALHASVEDKEDDSFKQTFFHVRTTFNARPAVDFTATA